MPTILDSLPTYEADLAARKMRPRSIGAYAQAIRSFAAYLEPGASITTITARTIGQYAASRSTWSSATMATQLSAIRSFCRWSIAAGLRLDDPTLSIAWPRPRRKLPRALRPELEPADLVRSDQVVMVRPDQLTFI